MKLLYTTLFGAVLLSGSLLTSCQEHLENYANSVYLGSTDKIEMVLVDVEAGESEKHGEVKTYLAKTESQDVNVTYAVDPALVSRYNAIKGTDSQDAILLPSEYYEIPTYTVTIKAGEVVAPGLTVNFKQLDQLDYTKVYVLPLNIVSSDVEILNSQRSIYYVIKKGALVNWSANLSKNNVYVDWKNPDVVNNLTQLTAEALIKVDAFADDRDSKISTIMGIEDKFLIRLGDATLPSDQLQVASGNGDNVTASDWKIKAGVWTHIAVTYNSSNKTVQVYINGKKKSEQQFTSFNGEVNWGIPHSDESDGKPRCFWIGYSYNDQRYLDGSIAECRVWNKVLTNEEINAKNHFYRVAPESDGLVAYWKFNDEKGNTVKDCTSNGNHATASNALTWVYVELPE